MELTSNEQSLKNLMEDMGPGDQLLKRNAELTLRALSRHFQDITYDQAMELYEENQKILEHTPWTDQAHEYLLNQRNELLKLAGALNDFHILGRHDHEMKIHAIVSIGSTAVECNLHVPKLNYYPAMHNKHVIATIRSKAARSSEWCGSLRNGIDIDFVEL